MDVIDVGKTYLIREYFSNKKCTYFEITGQKDGSLEQQLENFIKIFSKIFANDLPIRTPLNWKNAFELLTKEIEKISKSQNIVIFLMSCLGLQLKDQENSKRQKRKAHSQEKDWKRFS